MKSFRHAGMDVIDFTAQTKIHLIGRLVLQPANAQVKRGRQPRGNPPTRLNSNLESITASLFPSLKFLASSFLTLSIRKKKDG
jgi:hypothetical protein